jgi:hypothetical protein
VWGGTAPSPTDVWVGQVGVNTFQTMTVRWNGNRCVPVSSPPQTYANFSAAPDDAHGLWAVGNTAIASSYNGTLAQRCTPR